MIIKRNIITLYHITKTKNIPDILKNGLSLDCYKVRKENELMGIGNTPMIYTILDKNKLVKPEKPGYTIIQINIPKVDYDRMRKLEGDPVWHKFHKMSREIAYKEVYKVFKKLRPDLSYEEFIRYATPFEYLAPDNTICFLEDIPAKYINKNIL